MGSLQDVFRKESSERSESNHVYQRQKAIEQQPTIEFVEQIETAVDAVATQVPYTRQQIVSIAFTIVRTPGYIKMA